MLKRLVPTCYVLVVLISLLIAFDFEGYMRSSTAWLVAVVLTLPWSVVSVLFMWALFHGAGLEVFTAMYLTFAGLNGYILFRVLRSFEGPGLRRFLYGDRTAQQEGADGDPDPNVR